MTEYEVKKMKVSDLIPYINNPRNNESAVDAVASSIKNFGFKNPIVVDANMEIINGHTRLKAAKKLGMTEVPVIVADDLSKEQVKAYRIADNKVSELATWNDELLDIELVNLADMNFDMTEFGFDIEDLEFNTGEEKEIIEDEIPEKVENRVNQGDIWILGKHRLMCGDSTSSEQVSLLMNGIKGDMAFTDPPYNTGMSSKSNAGSTWLNHMFNDSFTEEEWVNLLSKFTKNLYKNLDEESVAYISLDWRRNHELIPYIKSAGFKLSNTIVWDKVVHGLGSDYKYTYELINVCKKGKPRLDTHKGDREYSDVWHIQRKIGKDDEHATKKPIELITRSISHVLKNTNVIDLFGGSGSTLIACEQLNKNCFMMEFDPNYCDVIIQRWENLTGQVAEKIN